MRLPTASCLALAVFVAASIASSPSLVPAARAAEVDTTPLVRIAQAPGDDGSGARETRREDRGLEPTYEPREPEEESWYNSDYLFGMTRGVANSTIAPAGKVPLFVLTVPLDIVFLPFAAIGGLFG
jgi:hypothetical protein